MDPVRVPRPVDHVPGEPMVDPRPMVESAVVVNGLPYVSLDWLRRMKRTAGRTKDQLDLEELEKLHGPPPSSADSRSFDDRSSDARPSDARSSGGQ